MAFVLADRVRETTTTAGTGAVSLAGAVSGFQTFSAAIGNSNNTYYTIADPITGAWEVGIGTYSSSGNTLSRDTVLSSSNSGSLVTFASNSKDVFVTQPASRAVFVQNAGTGLQTGTTAGTSGAVPYYNTTSTIASSAVLASNALVVGGGVGGAPATTTTGTGVVTAVGNAVNTSGGLVTQSGTLAASSLVVGGGSGTAVSTITTGTGVVTALGVNTGSAGAFVVNGGALGTPSSGTVTNLTGTASININGTVGATTPNTGNFTTVTASADSSFTSTGALLISKGTAAQQPGSPATGMIRYNTTSNEFEGYSGSSPAWKSIGGSALSNDTATSSNLYPVFAAATTGTAQNLYTSNAQYLFKPSTGELSVKAPRASNGILVNSATVSSDYTIASGDNGGSFGPVTVNSGITVTVSSGSVWTVV